MADIIWGAEIAVDGKQPSWLSLNDVINLCERPEGFYGTSVRVCNVIWHKGLSAIRLPADHPHYATLSTPTAPNTPAGYSDEVVGRAMALVAAMAARETDGGGCLDITRFLQTADAIHADLLPEPVDPDKAVVNGVLEGQIMHADADGFLQIAPNYLDKLLLDAVRAGRALAAGGR